MPVVLDTIKPHEHYDPTGTFRELHLPGERYELQDGIGLTAEQLAKTFIDLGVAIRVPAQEPAAVTKSKPAKSSRV